MAPRVSILLPNLNNRPYLEERIRTIINQTLSDWELIVVDSYSDDGAWEYFEECAQKDNRIRIYQSKERGIYNNFNTCIRLAQAEYVYFATSDDTMFPNALKEMVKALEENPECDLAHCKLRIIDEDGNYIGADMAWENLFIVRYFGNLINQKHIRKAPHDGVLHFWGITVYMSLTQLLIRRNLFEKIGLFLTDYGSIADFEWVMRATLIADTVHIPEYLATWRFHGKQATSLDFTNHAKASGKFIEMANHALKIARRFHPELINRLPIKELMYILEKEKFFCEIVDRKSTLMRCVTVAKRVFINYRLVIEVLYESVKKYIAVVFHTDSLHYESHPEHIRKMISKYGLDNNLKIIKKNNRCYFESTQKVRTDFR